MEFYDRFSEIVEIDEPPKTTFDAFLFTDFSKLSQKSGIFLRGDSGAENV